MWGDQTFRDGVDIHPDQFYARLKTDKVMATTPQGSVVTMQTTFHDLVEGGHSVGGVFISAKLSGTIQSAILGREALGTAAGKVTIIDSKSTSMAMGFQVLVAACRPPSKAPSHVAFILQSTPDSYTVENAYILTPKRWTCRSRRPGSHEEQGSGPLARTGSRTSKRQFEHSYRHRAR